MNQRPCVVAGCAAMRGPRTYSPYCQAHRLTQTRHGHPLQTSVTFYELAPFQATIRAAIKRNPSSEVWPILRARWGRLVDHAAAQVAERDNGRSFHRPTLQAAEMLLQVARHADETKVVEVMLALYLMEDSNPRRFKSDEALRFALARRLRHLAPMARGSYWNHKLQWTSSVYRDAPPKAVAILGAWLVEVFGLAGRMVAETERKRQAQVDDRQRLVEAAGALT